MIIIKIIILYFIQFQIRHTDNFPPTGTPASNNNVPSISTHHVERSFLSSLHCFFIRKMTKNAAGPADCFVSTTVQLVIPTSVLHGPEI